MKCFLPDTFLQFFLLVITLSRTLEVLNGLWPVVIPSVLQKICVASCAENGVKYFGILKLPMCPSHLTIKLQGILKEVFIKIHSFLGKSQL